MIRQFLRAKHYQIFILIFGIPFIAYLIWIFTVFSKIATNPENPFDIFDSLGFFPIIMFLGIASLYAWLYSIAIGLQRYVPQDIHMKTNRFKIFFYVPLVYIGFIMIVFSYFISNFNPESINPGMTPPDLTAIFPFIGLIIPLHFFSIFCMIYVLYFAAKTLKTAELKREVTFSDYVGEFFLLWFYIVGIWIVQPKINRMLQSHNDEINDYISEGK